MLPTDQGRSRVDEFLAKVTKKPEPARGSLVFALDATGSRKETWDMATHLQSQMFREVANLGSLDVKVIHFGGGIDVNATCKASNWMSDPIPLAAYMTRISCLGGLTQIGKVLDHVISEAGQRKIHATVYVGDAVEEVGDHLIMRATLLAERKIPVFVFQEGADPQAEHVFREIARVTGGAFGRFDQNSAKQLGDLLKAVAVFATGGIAALEQQGSGAARLLLGQLRS